MPCTSGIHHAEPAGHDDLAAALGCGRAHVATDVHESAARPGDLPSRWPCRSGAAGYQAQGQGGRGEQRTHVAQYRSPRSSRQHVAQVRGYRLRPAGRPSSASATEQGQPGAGGIACLTTASVSPPRTQRPSGGPQFSGGALAILSVRPVRFGVPLRGVMRHMITSRPTSLV